MLTRLYVKTGPLTKMKNPLGSVTNLLRHGNKSLWARFQRLFMYYDLHVHMGCMFLRQFLYDFPFEYPRKIQDHQVFA